jgi:Protein of unknown function (DUF3800)
VLVSANAESIHSFFETPHDRRPKSLLPLTTYVDESQQNETDRHVVVAGFCGSEPQWESFLPEWKSALGKKKALHMKNLRWGGDFGERRVTQLLARLGPIPYKHGLCPVYGAVKVSDYIDLIKGEAELEKKVCGYILCLSTIFSALTRDLPGYAEIKIICEQQDQYEPLARGLFDSFGRIVARDPRSAYFRSIGFIPKDDSPLTQPADFLAFAITKYLDERGSTKDLGCRPIFGGKDPEKIPGRLYTREKAIKTLQDIKKGLKARRPSN